MPEKIEPYGHRILVRPEQVQERSTGGIHIPAQAQEVSQRGTIIASGQDVTPISQLLSPGDLVIYSKYAGMTYEHEGEKLLFLAEQDILGVVRTERAVEDTPAPTEMEVHG